MVEPIGERNKQVIRRLLEESDRGNLEAVEALYSPDFVDHNPSAIRRGALGRAGLRMVFGAVLRAFPDTRHTIEDLVSEGDRVAARITARGTHTGEFMGIPPSGALLEQTNIVIYRILEGRIAERWSYEVEGLLDQIRSARRGSV
ncbi:MAG TPA: ester cyclase [Dongiaceae bacterium]|nr:ester cyclase [Dongiaceae bacterium]